MSSVNGGFRKYDYDALSALAHERPHLNPAGLARFYNQRVGGGITGQAIRGIMINHPELFPSKIQKEDTSNGDNDS